MKCGFNFIIAAARVLSVAAACIAVQNLSAQTPEELRQIEEAMPAEAPAKPKKPRKVLVFTLTKGFRHDSIPCGEKALQLLGEKTGAYTATISQNESDFSAENLKQYDAVVFCNNTGELFSEPFQREALLSFVREGKGIAGIHAATDCCYQWAPYGDMMGGYFDGHPWNAPDTVTIRIEDTTHPVMAAFPDPLFTVTDEIYQFKDPYSRAKQNVLASLDPQKTDMSKKGIKRPDQDFPVAWVRNFGKGRVFYCSLGHNKHIYWNPVILKHYLAGIQFATGDLEADASPDRPGDRASLEQMLPVVMANAAQTTYSGTVSAHPELELYLQRARKFPAVRSRAAEEIAKRLKVLADEGSTESYKSVQFFGEKLGEIGTASNVPALSELLSHPNAEAAEAARKALERIPGEAATAALLERLKAAEGEERIGLINSLGERSDAGAAEPLVKILGSQEVRTVNAAAAALGKIPTITAARALLKATDSATTEPQRSAFADATLYCGAGLLSRGARAQANEIAFAVFRNDAIDESRRAAALLLMVSADPQHNLGLAVQHFVHGHGDIQEAAAHLLAQSDEEGVAGKLIQRLDAAEPERKAAILQLLAYRRASQALPAIREAVDAENKVVRIAGLHALGKLGNTQDAVRLAEIAASAQDEEVRSAARESIARVGGSEVNSAIIRKLKANRSGQPQKEDVAFRVELIRALAARHAMRSVDTLLAIAAQEENPATVQAEAFKALSQLAGPGHAAPLLDVLVTKKNERVLKEAERAALSSIRQIEDENARPGVILDRLSKVSSPAAKAALVRVLGNFGGPQALAALRELVNNAEIDAVRDAAVRALANFPTADALQDVREIAKSSENPVHQALAVRGYARLLSLPADRNSSETLHYAAEALELAKGTEDKRMVISELGGIATRGTVGLLRPFLENEELREDAMASIAKLAATEAAFAPQETLTLLRAIEEKSTSDETKKLAKQQIEAVQKLDGYLTVWEVAGPYIPPKRTSVAAMLDLKYSPEESQDLTATTWTVVAAGTNPEKPEMVDLGKALKGTSRVAYLRTRVWAEQATTAVLELGSDDGVRVWLNGEVVHSNPATGPYAPKEDTVQLNLREGWNDFLLKVTQGSGDWSASARLASPGGGALTGIRQNLDDPCVQEPFAGLNSGGSTPTVNGGAG